VVWSAFRGAKPTEIHHVPTVGRSRTRPEIIEFSVFQIPASMAVVEFPRRVPEDVDFQGHAVYLVIPQNRVGTIRDPPTEINGPESTKLRVSLW